MTNGIEILLKEVRMQWELAGIALAEPATVRDLQEFETAHQIAFPRDVAIYFLTLGGMQEGESDRHGIRFWPLHEVEAASVALSTSDAELEGYYAFADYSIWAHGYAVKVTANCRGDVAIVGGVRVLRTAPSFVEFWKRYLNDPNSIFIGEADDRVG